MKYRYMSMVLLLGVLCHACYEDKGNYEYIDLDVVVAGIEDDYVVERLNELTIEPSLSGNNISDQDFDYLWTMYMGTGDTSADTLSHDYKLNVLIGAPSGDYNAVFLARSKDTGVEYRHDFNIKVVDALSDGLVVLSEIDGKANICFMSITGQVHQDTYQRVNGGYYDALDGRDHTL